MSTEYLPRLVDTVLTQRLQSRGAVLIEGPKACGKTETALQVAASQVRLDIDADARRAAQVDPSLVLDGDRPRLLDEWQLEPALWDHVRRLVDDTGEPGQFILTGSATPGDDARQHSGAGRFATLQMRPMCCFELGRSSGEVSLAALLDGEPASGSSSDLDLPDVLDLLVAGGWPQQARSPDPDFCSDYLDQIIQVDINQLDVRRDPDRVRAALASLARNTATAAGDKTIADDIGVARQTAAAYGEALRRLRIVEDQPAYNTHLRSSRNLRTTPRRHLVDPSLATAALEVDRDALLEDLNFAGLLFESMVVRDLRVLATPLAGRVAYFKTDDHEIDIVVHLRDGTFGAVEAKLGGDRQIDQGAASLLAASASIEGEPAFLAVVTAIGGFAYQRDDGVDVIPLTALGP